MIVKCEDMSASGLKHTYNMQLELTKIDFCALYMDNTKEEIEKFLNEIPIEKLEEYILKRKEKEDE